MSIKLEAIFCCMCGDRLGWVDRCGDVKVPVFCDGCKRNQER